MLRHNVRIYLMLLMLFFWGHINAQEQHGIVRKIATYGSPSRPLEDVLIRVDGIFTASLSNPNGEFRLTLPHYENGQAFCLISVSKPGYRLVDVDLLSTPLPFSDIVPLEIRMISEDEFNASKAKIEAQIYSSIHANYELKLSELKKQLDSNIISLERFREENEELKKYYNNVDNLINELAERYAMTDYDRLDSLDIRINTLIEQGALEEAKLLILSKGDIADRTNQLSQSLANLQKLNDFVEETAKKQRKKAESLINDLYTLIRIYIDKNDYDQVVAKYEELIQLQIMLDGDTHPEIAMNYSNVAYFLIKINRYEEALMCYDKSLMLFSEIYGHRHPHVASALSNLSVLYLKTNDWDKAIEYSLKALSISEEVDSYDHSVVMLRRYGVANVYFEAGMNEQAIPYLTEVHRDSYEKSGPDDRYTTHYFMYLHQMYMGAQGSASYDGSLDESYAELSRNTM